MTAWLRTGAGFVGFCALVAAAFAPVYVALALGVLVARLGHELKPSSVVLVAYGLALPVAWFTVCMVVEKALAVVFASFGGRGSRFARAVALESAGLGVLYGLATLLFDGWRAPLVVAVGSDLGYRAAEPYVNKKYYEVSDVASSGPAAVRRPEP